MPYTIDQARRKAAAGRGELGKKRIRNRSKPYTDRGVRRLKCFRCGKGATTQWQICADGNTWRPLCTFCDIELNKVVLEFMRFPKRKLMGAHYEADKIRQFVEEEKLKGGKRVK